MNDKIDLIGKFQYRTKSPFEFRESFMTLQTEYRLSKRINVFGGYRHSIVPNNYSDLSTNRLNSESRFLAGFKIDLLGGFLKDKGLKRLKIKYRPMFQYETHRYSVNDSYFRNKFTISYRIKKWELTPFFVFESFYHFNELYTYNSSEIKVSSAFDESRYKVGVDWKLNKQITLGLEGIYRSYHFQSENDYIYKLSIKYSLPKKD